MIIRTWIEYLINPFCICIFLLAWTLFLVKGQTLVRWVLGFVLSCLLLISTGWLPRTMTYRLENQYPIVHKVDPNVKWIVVLGGGQTQALGMPANDLLSSGSIKRLVEGVRLWRKLPQSKLVLSGGATATEQYEGLLMAQLAQWFSIPRENMVLEIKSFNTADQAKELGQIVHKEAFYLVTSASHMPRAMSLCRQQGLHPIAAPTDFTWFWETNFWGKLIIPNPYNAAYFSVALHEVLGSWWARIQKSPLSNAFSQGGQED